MVVYQLPSCGGGGNTSFLGEVTRVGRVGFLLQMAKLGCQWSMYFVFLTWFSHFAVRLRPSLIPRTPKEFPKAATPRTHTKSEIKITSKQAETTHSKVRKPSTLTIDNPTYEAICSRKPTRPTLVTSPRKLVLPPPPQDGSWSYTTTRF